MIRKIGMFTIAMAMVFAFFCARPDEASAQFRVGPHVGYNFDAEVAFVGADAWFGIFKLSDMIQIHANLGASYYFLDVDDVTLVRFDLNVPLLFDVGSPAVKPYVAPGLAVGWASTDNDSETDVGLNLIGGALFLTDGMFQPFVQFRVTISESTEFDAMGGVMFKL